MLRRFASVVAVGAMAVTSYSVMVAAPASAGEERPNTIKVTKVVKGDSKGAGFQVVVECKHNEDKIALGSSSKTLTFGPEGGTQEVKAANGVTCTIVETHDGGATTVDVSPAECVFPEEDLPAAAPAPPTSDEKGITCPVTVTNTFVPEQEQAGPAGPAGPQGPPGESAVAATAVVSIARFTG